MPADEIRPPVIGVTGRRFPEGSPFRREAAVAIQSDYLDAVTRAGGVGVVLPPDAISPAEAARRVAVLDGLILTGGADVDPDRYGQAAAPETYEVSELQDTFETELLRAAQAAAVPVLAICRGLQILNVALGGTLHQHITGGEGIGAHGIPNGGGGSDNDISIDADSLLASVVGATSMSGRCHHHQAVDRVADGLIVSARTADGVVEALEPAEDSIGPWLIAVQWHPEETAVADPTNQRLFDHLVEAARR